MDIQQTKGAKVRFSNGMVNKRQLKDLMSSAFHTYGIVKSAIIADRVKNLTFHYATKSGISLSIEDLRVPQKKRPLIGLTNDEVENTEQQYEIGNITNIERFQKVIDIWNNASNFLKDEVTTYFRESDPLNSLYIMAFSGARGNISQVRQLVGMRGLMADPQGQIIDLPIQSNFREGLTVTEYIISSYGARKGLVDTALRTADSGYLTRRLVDVAQDIIVRENDCQTSDGLTKQELINETTPNLSLNDRLVGRLLIDPLTRTDNGEILVINTVLTTKLLNELPTPDLEKLKVRSPLTCNSIRSVCRNCYGWHLAYSKLVDLGEAIGIIAAQSIGEPGTQLTMRTFHTGGVFSGDLTRQIRAPFKGTLTYKIVKNANLVRTLHGEKCFVTSESNNLYIENEKGVRSKITIPKGATLLSNTGQKVYTNQIIAEIKKDANLVLEEDSKTVYTNVSGEVFFQDLKIEENIDKQGSLVRKNQKAGLIWVLQGERYFLPRASKLIGKVGHTITKNSIIAQKEIVNSYPGIVKLYKSSPQNEIRILNFSFFLQNGNIITPKNITPGQKQNNKIVLDNKHEFYLTVQHNELLHPGQTIAILNENTYRTETGGTLTYNLEKKFGTKKRKSVNKVFSGSLYWIPEETHYVKNLTLFEKLKEKHGHFVTKGTELLPKIFAKVDGLVQISKLTQQLTIKPGELLKIRDSDFPPQGRNNGFVKPGEKIGNLIVAQKLVYVEFITIKNATYLLVRPVQIYDVPREKGFVLKHNFFPFVDKQGTKIKTIKKIFLKNWQQIKSNKSVELLETSLIFDSSNQQTKLRPQFEFLENDRNNYRLQISFYEVIKIDELIQNSESTDIKTSTKLVTHDNQYVNKHSTLAQLKIFLPNQGQLVRVNTNMANVKEALILHENDIRIIRHYSKVKDLNIKIGDLIRAGSQLTKTIKSEYSGQVYKIDDTNIYVRAGRPYLISEGAILEVESGSLVQRLDKLATLIYEKLKTVDIVQGLPKVEEILEARKIKNPCILAPCNGYVNLRNSKIELTNEKNESTAINVDSRTKLRFTNGSYVKLGEPLTDGPVSPHNKLETLFNYFYYIDKLPINQACRYSFRGLQLFLVNEVQQTYLSQGVQIADKHVEIIVKQMTSKVRIIDSGDTILLPGELLNLYQAELITQSNTTANAQPPFYLPTLLGITKASLNSESFISAASFQETTRVLTEAAIEGKKDWLHGLKENVIIGRLIPAGTGFKYYTNLNSSSKNIKITAGTSSFQEKTENKNIKGSVLSSRFN